MRTISGIYKITNLLNGKCYIGLSYNINKRFREHKHHIVHKNGSCHLYHAIDKYGLDNFSFEILKECPIEDLACLEQFFIRVYCSWHPNYGYNKTFGGQKGMYGLHFSDSQKEKCRKSAIKRFQSQEERFKQSERALNRVWYTNGTEDIHIKNESSIPENFYKGRCKFTAIPSDAFKYNRKGKTYSDQAKQNMSKAKKGIKFSEKHKENLAKASKKRASNQNDQIHFLTSKNWENEKIKETLLNHLKSLHEQSKGTHYYNNGIICIRTKECPDGFVPGMIKRVKN
jgi:group I intron endonuclease